MQDRKGDWWIPTGQGLCRYSGLPTLEGLVGKPPSAIYTSKNGLPSDDIFRLYEDSRGDIWIATYSEKGNGLTRRERATGIFHNFTDADGLPLKTCVPSSICEDRAGNLWIGFDSGGGLARFRDGRFRLFPQLAGEPPMDSPSLYVDWEGRLWIATGFQGLDRMDDPTSDNPHVTSLTTSEGLYSNRVLSITEDLWGRLYIGTGRGVDRLEVTTGHIRHYTSADGLVDGEVRTSFRDRQGRLWFGSTRGLSQFIPERDPPASPPPVLIGGLHINGVAYPVSELGESNISDLRLKTDQNNVEIDFFALSFSLGEVLRYRYRLDGADRAWSKWAEQRSINYASLRPGNYRFQVEAEDSEGNTSPLAATVSFMVLPPIWRRCWFLGLATLITGGVLAGAYNYRVSYLLEMERIRTRIATDLHDDIGSSLSQIAILSEVVRQRLGPVEAGICEPLTRIADISRELVDSMSDIVWAINPQKDLLGNLTQRMRRFASDVFTAKGITFQFQATMPEQDIRVGAELRRQIFLIFKEGIHNIVRHSGCTSARVGFLFDSGFVILTLEDNGKGFDSSEASLGHGLANMRSRSEQLGGQLTVSSQSNQGTTITLRAPLRSNRILRRNSLLPV
jgi:signal transduction histidine kinase